jgi:hypothetical protein
MKQLTVLIILLLFLSHWLQAQSLYWSDITPARCFFGNKNLTLDKIQGSPYLSGNFVEGEVITSKGTSFKGVPLRYNCYNDILEYKKDDKPFEIMPKDQVSRAEFGGRVFCYLEYENGKGFNKSYFQILTGGKATLCVKYSISFFEREEVRAFSESKPERFDDFKVTYWISLDKTLAKPILNKNKLLDIFSGKKDEVERYISSQKLSIKSADDLKKIVDYYNTL